MTFQGRTQRAVPVPLSFVEGQSLAVDILIVYSRIPYISTYPTPSKMILLLRIFKTHCAAWSHDAVAFRYCFSGRPNLMAAICWRLVRRSMKLYKDTQHIQFIRWISQDAKFHCIVLQLHGIQIIYIMIVHSLPHATRFDLAPTWPVQLIHFNFIRVENVLARHRWLPWWIF